MFGYKLLKEEVIVTYDEQIQKLKQEIAEASEFINQLQEDSTKAIYDGEYASNGLIGNLLSMQSGIKKLAENEKKQNWVAFGLAKFADVMRDNFDTQRQMGDEVLANIIPYLDANQGGLFLIKEEEDNYTTLELIASYAYNRKKFIQKIITVEEDCAEGLIGQVFLEKREIYLSKLPEDYLKITSGLGESNPRYLFISPLLDGEEAIGVLEIASFRPFEDYHQEFIKKLCENLASTVINTRINERTRSLLMATREQTEELLAQDEELRQNMEELQTTQEELQRLLQEQVSTMAAIDSASISAEFDSKGNILRINEAFIKFFGYEENELLGQNHKLLIHPSLKDGIEYKEFWDKIRKGINITQDFERLTNTGETKWIRGTYYPIKNSRDEIIKILKIAYDITLEKEQEVKLIENQRIIEQNQILLKERTKSIQDKAYERIKALKSEIAEKDKVINKLQEEKRIH
jgi:methyl-accepting chemotaxis protein